MKNYAIYVKGTVEIFTQKLFFSLFDKAYRDAHQQGIETDFFVIFDKLNLKNAQKTWLSYQNSFEEIRKRLDLDAIAFEKNDPACKSLVEVYLAYPGFFAIAIYRLSHALLQLKTPILPRMMSEYSHSVTGTDIHPGAQIGESFFIDHATGIVIGETTIIGNFVKIYQGVTLGGIHVKKSFASTKRHPTIENNVTIYANATILGGEVIVGENSIIGANVCISETVPKNAIVSENKQPKITIRNL